MPLPDKDPIPHDFARLQSRQGCFGCEWSDPHRLGNGPCCTHPAMADFFRAVASSDEDGECQYLSHLGPRETAARHLLVEELRDFLRSIRGAGSASLMHEIDVLVAKAGSVLLWRKPGIPLKGTLEWREWQRALVVQAVRDTPFARTQSDVVEAEQLEIVREALAASGCQIFKEELMPGKDGVAAHVRLTWLRTPPQAPKKRKGKKA